MEEGGGRGEAAARLRSTGRFLQLCRDALVEPRTCVCEMPGSPVGVGLRIGHFGEGAVYVSPLNQPRRTVDRRSHEWVTESHPPAELDETGLRRRFGCLTGHTQQLGRAPDGHGIADRLRRGDEQEFLRGWRKPSQPAPETLFDLTRERRTGRQPESSRQLGVRQAVWQLHQGQRVTVRFGHDPVAHPSVQRPRDRGLEQGSRVILGQAADRQLRKTRQLSARLALRKDQGNPLRVQPPSHEGK